MRGQWISAMAELESALASPRESISHASSQLVVRVAEIRAQGRGPDDIDTLEIVGNVEVNPSIPNNNLEEARSFWIDCDHDAFCECIAQA